MEPPPGLVSKPRQQGQAALKGVGLELELQPLEEVLKAYLDSLPKEVKDAVVGLIKPARAATIDVTGQLKATVGELRQLSTKKQSLQRRVDQAKDQYKLLLDELKGVQEAIDHRQRAQAAGRST